MKDDHMRIPRERKVIMGYFDEVKAAREEENTLEHSSGAWKKHKYIQKIGEGANAVYKYAKKKVDTDITGNAYKKEAGIQKFKSEDSSDFAKDVKKEAESIGTLDTVTRGGTLTRDIYNRNANEAAYHGRKAAEAESAYYTKSLAGKSKATVEKGKALIKDFFTPKTKVTVSSNLTGKETINTKPAEKVTLKKNKLSFKKK